MLFFSPGCILTATLSPLDRESKKPIRFNIIETRRFKLSVFPVESNGVNKTSAGNISPPFRYANVSRALIYKETEGVGLASCQPGEESDSAQVGESHQPARGAAALFLVEVVVPGDRRG